jgi:hypothetical protein
MGKDQAIQQAHTDSLTIVFFLPFVFASCALLPRACPLEALGEAARLRSLCCFVGA